MLLNWRTSGALVVMCLAVGTVCASEADRPNILFCIADDASFAHMGAYGCSWVETPGFDRVGEEGILFTRCYTPNAKCAPSRSCILTGRNSWQLEEAANHWPHFPVKFKTYAETLIEHDYHVGYTGKGWAPGRAVDAEGKKRELAGPAYQKKTTKPPAKAISGNDYAANFDVFLEKQPEGRPFCFWYGGYEPHRAYEYGAGLKYGQKKLEQIDKVFKFWPDNETVRTDMLDYAFEIEYFDQHLQKMLAALERAGKLDNTLVIVTADNGMPFPRIKGQEYEYSNHLPLAIMWKKGIKNPGRKVDDFVNFIDFAPTYLELAGVDGEQAGMHPIEGRSLTEIFNSKADGIVCPDRDHILIGKERHDIGRPHDWGYPIRGIVKGDYLYLRNFEPTRWPAGNPETGYLNTDGSPTKTQILNMRRDGSEPKFWTWAFGKRPEEQMFNVVDDPECMNDLAGDAKYAEVREAMKKQMVAELRDQKDPRMLGRGYVFDGYEYADKSGFDFYGRFMRGEKLRAGWVEATDFEKEPVKE
jgi:N-sulfoglucosamine sulfohydrolase